VGFFVGFFVPVFVGSLEVIFVGCFEVVFVGFFVGFVVVALLNKFSLIADVDRNNNLRFTKHGKFPSQSVVGER
jgi:hypothetical protein